MYSLHLQLWLPKLLLAVALLLHSHDCLQSVTRGFGARQAAAHLLDDLSLGCISRAHSRRVLTLLEVFLQQQVKVQHGADSVRVCVVESHNERCAMLKISEELLAAELSHEWKASEPVDHCCITHVFAMNAAKHAEFTSAAKHAEIRCKFWIYRLCVTHNRIGHIHCRLYQGLSCFVYKPSLVEDNTFCAETLQHMQPPIQNCSCRYCQ